MELLLKREARTGTPKVSLKLKYILNPTPGMPIMTKGFQEISGAGPKAPPFWTLKFGVDGSSAVHSGSKHR